MDIIIGFKRTYIQGPSITWDCPHCGKAAVAAITSDRTEQASLFHIVPLFSVRNTLVTCGTCRRQSLSKLRAAELARVPLQQLPLYVSGRISFVTQAVVALSIILFWIPIAGLVLAVAGFMAGRRHTGWIRTTSIMATIAAVIVTLLIGFILIADRLGI